LHGTVIEPTILPCRQPHLAPRLNGSRSGDRRLTTSWGAGFRLSRDGVPHGKIVGSMTVPCKVYPGTAHTYWVYVPAQYDKSKPASLMIFNDGQAFKNEKETSAPKMSWTT